MAAASGTERAGAFYQQGPQLAWGRSLAGLGATAPRYAVFAAASAKRCETVPAIALAP